MYHVAEIQVAVVIQNNPKMLSQKILLPLGQTCSTLHLRRSTRQLLSGAKHAAALLRYVTPKDIRN